MTRTTSVALAAIVLAALQGAPRDAQAFQRELADGTGKPLYWQYLPVTYAINASCAGAQENTTDCLDAVQRSFDAWTRPACTVLRFDYQGTTGRTDVGFDQSRLADNVNLVIWHLTGWPYDKQALALTTTTYRPSDGVIMDSDLEVNGEDFPWRVLTSNDTNYMDIANTVTHEAGHFLGLDHVNDRGSTMYPSAPLGETSKQALSPDDIDGVCSIYPVEGYDGGSGGGNSGGGAATGDGAGGGSAGIAEDGNGSFGKAGGCGCTTIMVEG